MRKTKHRRYCFVHKGLEQAVVGNGVPPTCAKCFAEQVRN